MHMSEAIRTTEFRVNVLPWNAALAAAFSFSAFAASTTGGSSTTWAAMPLKASLGLKLHFQKSFIMTSEPLLWTANQSRSRARKKLHSKGTL